MRLGIFGGTFNPIHNGHTRLATYFQDILSLDEVLIVPANLPPHKTPDRLADGIDRLNMCRLAADPLEGITVTDMEMRKEGLSYTIDTLLEVLETYPGANIFLLMGSDVFLSLKEWNRFPELLEIATFCTAARLPGEGETLLAYGQELRETGAEIFIGDLTELPVSSTAIRDILERGGDAGQFLAPPVNQYLTALDLYGPSKPYAPYVQLMEKMVNPRRARHCLCVAKEAACLAAKHGEDVKKAYIAGILHDVLRDLSPEEMLQAAPKSGIMLSAPQRLLPAVWHGLLAPEYLKNQGMIDDEVIFSAIRAHTIGAPGMTKFDRILYLADAISYDRDYEDLDKAKEAAARSIEEGMWYVLAFAMGQAMAEKKPLLEETWQAYNENRLLLAAQENK